MIIPYCKYATYISAREIWRFIRDTDFKRHAVRRDYGYYRYKGNTPIVAFLKLFLHSRSPESRRLTFIPIIAGKLITRLGWCKGRVIFQRLNGKLWGCYLLPADPPASRGREQ